MSVLSAIAGGSILEVVELVGFQDATDDLAWTRPNLLTLRYELVSPAGTLGRIGIQGIGPDRYVLGETAEACWRIDLFPISKDEVSIWRDGDEEPSATYNRSKPVEVRFLDGTIFRFQEAQDKTVLLDADSEIVFTVEMAEKFPRWRAELKLEPRASALLELPVLLMVVCCILVF